MYDLGIIGAGPAGYIAADCISFSIILPSGPEPLTAL